MFATNLMQSAQHPPAHKEGDLYRELMICGHVFTIRYGYYEDFERESPFNEPMPIYPDFIENPLYTSEGIPFVTAMQDVCKYYEGKDGGDSCAECRFFRKSEELFGFCFCSENNRSQAERTVVKNE